MSPPRFKSTADGAATPEMQAAYARDGFLVVEGFKAPANATRCAPARTNSSKPRSLHRDQHLRGRRRSASRGRSLFPESGDEIRFFFEKGAFDEAGRLTKDKHAAMNKIGHAMHDLDPVFDRFSRDPKLANLARSLGLKDPGPVQSMVIFKPRIGGEVDCHQDATFLHTDPVSVTGFWFALEDADETNGCLVGIPGVQNAGLRERFHYEGDRLVMDKLGEKDWPVEREVPSPPRRAPSWCSTVWRRTAPRPIRARAPGRCGARDRSVDPLERRQLAAPAREPTGQGL